MRFIEWTIQEEQSNHNAVNPKTMKTRRDRDRLTRMEAMLAELVTLKQIIVDAKAPEKTHAKK